MLRCKRLAQRPGHCFGIAIVAHGSVLCVERTPRMSGACVADPFVRAKGSDIRYVHRTLKGCKQQVVSTALSVLTPGPSVNPDSPAASATPHQTQAGRKNNFPTGALLCSTLIDGASEIHPCPFPRPPRRLERGGPAPVHRPAGPRLCGRRGGEVARPH